MKMHHIDPRAFRKLGGQYLQESDHERARQKAIEDRKQQDENYVALNNLYLLIEAGKLALNLHYSLMLRDLAVSAYPVNDKSMQDYWEREFQQLPRWNDF